VVNLFGLVVIVESFWRLNEAIFGKKEVDEPEDEEGNDKNNSHGKEGEEEDLKDNHMEDRGDKKNHEKEPEKK
jgi:hypothetical protein